MAKADPALAGADRAALRDATDVAPTALEMLVGRDHRAAGQPDLRLRVAGRAWCDATAPGGVEARRCGRFPTATALARRRLSELRAMQFSTRKAEYIRDSPGGDRVAPSTSTGSLAATNADVIGRLTALRGLGRWTADWFLARCLGRGDVCPAGDLAVRKAFAHYYGRGRTLSERAIRRRARAWGPYQNLAVHYLLAGMRLARPRAAGGLMNRKVLLPLLGQPDPNVPRTSIWWAATRSG